MLDGAGTPLAEGRDLRSFPGTAPRHCACRLRDVVSGCHAIPLEATDGAGGTSLTPAVAGHLFDRRGLVGRYRARGQHRWRCRQRRQPPAVWTRR